MLWIWTSFSQKSNGVICVVFRAMSRRFKITFENVTLEISMNFKWKLAHLLAKN